VAGGADPAQPDLGPGHPGTLNASVSAGLTKDKTYAWDVTKYDGQLGAVSLSAQVTVTDNGSVATTDLTVKGFLEQKGTGSRWNMVGSVHQLSVPSQLQPGQTGNYQFG
jgi:hypothetical protein